MAETANQHHVSVPPEILTISGRYFSYVTPEASVFTIEDIAHGLSHVCRFAGQCREFYSVAQHSVLVSMIVPPHLALAGLMHDATEAFMGDVASPLKRLIPQYKEIEKRVERAIFERFGIALPLPIEVKQADLIALATEQRDLMTSHDRNVWVLTRGLDPLDVTIIPMDALAARRAFLARFQELTAIA
jgi:5'-deoxynucleotidase YfbR-like HD superfamily hydrolase